MVSVGEVVVSVKKSVFASMSEKANRQHRHAPLDYLSLVQYEGYRGGYEY